MEFKYYLRSDGSSSELMLTVEVTVPIIEDEPTGLTTDTLDFHALEDKLEKRFGRKVEMQ